MSVISTRMGIDWGVTMAGDLDPVSEILGSLKTSRESIESHLSKLTDKIDTALPKITDHDKRLTDVEINLKPLVDAHNRRLWVRLGWGAGITTLVSSPLWAAKILPFLAALPK